MKSQVFNTAWNFIKNRLFTSFSDALKFAWKKILFVNKLKSGSVEFFYEKLDGSKRKALGTLNESLFSYDNKGNKLNKNALIISYFDLDIREFRCFYITKLV